MEPTGAARQSEEGGGSSSAGGSAAGGGEEKASTATPSEILETEWQFDVPDLGAVRKWLSETTQWGPLRILPGKLRRIQDLYLDTLDLRILRAGYALRIRQTAGSTEGSLKELAPPTGSLSVRREITQPLSTAFKAALFEGRGLVTDRLRILCREEELEPLAPIRTERQTYQVFYGPESGEATTSGLPQAEVALDRTVLADSLGRTHRLSRLEMEVAPEDVPIFRELAEHMKEEFSLGDARQSKFEWALDAGGVRVDRTLSLGAVKVARSMSMGQVADAVLRKHLASFLWHEPGSRLGDDPEHLHDMRVAGRRMRAALRLFGGAYPEGEAERLRARLGEVGRHLGKVRDLDVFIENVKELRVQLLSVDGAACDPLLAYLGREREEAREQMRELLDSAAFASLKRDLVRLLHSSPPAGRPEAERPILHFAPRVIRRARRRMMRLGRTLKPDSPAAEYHRLRILGKRLRYTLEFLEGVYGEVVSNTLALLVEIQDLLGLHQDAKVSADKLRVIVSERPAGFTTEGWVALGELSQIYHSYTEQLRRELSRPLRRTDRRCRRVQKRADKEGPTKGEDVDPEGSESLPNPEPPGPIAISPDFMPEQ